MAIKTSTVGEVVVVKAKGKLMGGKETEECHVKVKELIAQDYKKVVIDLSKVKWVNSRGLGMLIACFTSLRNVGGDLKIAGATEKTNSLLMITKLITVFENFETIDEAVASYK
jgi:anti-sigma B factor antagonist